MQAVAHGGRWYVRIDDIDPPRIRPGAVTEILSQLQQYGFFQRDNGGIHFENRHVSLSTATTAITLQSDNNERYQQALDYLISKDCVYACECTRRQLGNQRVYPGTCRERQLAFKQQVKHHSSDVDGTDTRNAKHAIRFRVTGKSTSFNDKVFGRIEQNVAREVGDFIIKRRDGLWSYQLATVVDDWHDRVTEVVRGADLLDNTPRQIALLQQLSCQSNGSPDQHPAQSGYRPPISKQPEFLHVPVALDGLGKKLSKQTRAEAIDATRPLPALLATWQFLGQPRPSKCETIAQFWQHAELSWDISRIPATQAIEPENHEFR